MTWKFWHDESITVPHLIRLAISHYQFETIHPFLDGNGRIGRLLVVFGEQRAAGETIVVPVGLFERNRASYYDALMRVRVSNAA